MDTTITGDRMLSLEDRTIIRLAETCADAGTIRTETGLSYTRYLQRLAKLMTNREALEASPVLMHRLNRLAYAHTARRRARST